MQALEALAQLGLSALLAEHHLSLVVVSPCKRLGVEVEGVQQGRLVLLLVAVAAQLRLELSAVLMLRRLPIMAVMAATQPSKALLKGLAWEGVAQKAVTVGSQGILPNLAAVEAVAVLVEVVPSLVLVVGVKVDKLAAFGVLIRLVVAVPLEQKLLEPVEVTDVVMAVEADHIIPQAEQV